MNALTRDRALADLQVLARAHLDLASFVQEVHANLQRAIPSDGQGFGTLDPSTVLPTGGCFLYGCLSPIRDVTKWAELEYLHPEPTSLRQLVRDGVPAAGAAVTHGDAVQSRRLREYFMPGHGLSDELRILGLVHGRPWGSVDLVRTRGTFTAEEVEFATSISGYLGDGLRAAVVSRDPSVHVPEIPQHSVLVINRAGEVLMSSPGAAEWLKQVTYTPDDGTSVEIVVAALVAAARYADLSDTPWPSVRIRLDDGSWTVLRARVLQGRDGQTGCVAITSAPSTGPEVESILSELFGLTARERDVTRWIVSGADTRQTARQLGMSSYTVQDHLKSIFAKVGVHSRRELAARMSAPYANVSGSARR